MESAEKNEAELIPLFSIQYRPQCSRASQGSVTFLTSCIFRLVQCGLECNGGGLDADFAEVPDCQQFRCDTELLQLESLRFRQICLKLKACVENEESLPGLQVNSCHPLHCGILPTARGIHRG